VSLNEFVKIYLVIQVYVTEANF